MSEEEVDIAAAALDDKLRHEPWFISSGVGETKSGFIIYIYVKNEAGPRRFGLDRSWMGFPLTVRVTGKIKRLGRELNTA